ncbi:enoyl-CoA hydratase/isomerase family protein [Amycolatopsis sp. NPDC047767]|uniref:enoyl-CoA hydratase/isomerase family protein n=1 Tax=Amycolatopsis sp. NPDC047767 TaxID=3156765 RepID=UPI0034561272
MTERLHVEITGRVATVRLDHPPLNAFDTGMSHALADTAARLADSDEVHAVVLYGGEKVFAAGADIKQLAGFSFEEVLGWNRALQKAFTRFAELPMPVVAAVNGYALGGGMELALTADYRVASETAVLGQPEVLLGIIPGSGGTQRLARLIGPSRAKELLMTGRRVAAPEALSLGLVDRIAPDPLAAALEYAQVLAAGPRFAIQAVKEAVDHGLDSSIAAGLALERSLIAGLFATRDRDTGMASFLRDGPGKAAFDRDA